MGRLVLSKLGLFTKEMAGNNGFLESFGGYGSWFVLKI